MINMAMDATRMWTRYIVIFHLLTRARRLCFCSCDEILGSPQRHSLGALEKSFQLCAMNLLEICFFVSLEK